MRIAEAVASFPPGQPVLAAGALVWRVVGRRLQVLLIHRPRYDDWSWPKGKLDAGETLPACAVREVKEESGIHVVLGLPLPSVRYQLTDGRTKVCTYWAATPAPADSLAVKARVPVKPSSKHEVDEARWLDARAAYQLLTREDDREPLGALIDLHEDDVLRTWTVVVARHGRARNRSAWKGDEDTRPLTTAGRVQAHSIVPILAAFGVEEVISSPWARCTQSVEPYVQASGADLLTAPQVTEAAARRDPSAVRRLIADLLGSRRAATVLCTHRPVLPLVLEAISARSPHRVLKSLPERDPYLRTGEVLMVHLASRGHRRPRVIALERHRGATPPISPA